MNPSWPWSLVLLAAALLQRAAAQGGGGSVPNLDEATGPRQIGTNLETYDASPGPAVRL